MLVAVKESAAQRRGVSLIRDAEIEHIIASYVTPLSRAAHLDPDAVEVHILLDPTINAFVAGGQRIFINTGLLMRAESPNQVIGVIAHEMGHVAGGHLARTQEALSHASVPAILSMVLGVVAIAAGQGEAGAAVIAGGQHIAQRHFLQYSRTQESAADQAAVTFLDATQQSGRGLIQFLDIIGDQEALLTSNQDPYVRSHPISRERVDALQRRVEQSPYRDRKDSEQAMEQFRRMQAKLVGYIKGLPQTLRDYPETDTSIPARYARAVAYFRKPDLKKALAEIDSLIADKPDDPYFHELKGQMLFEHGHIAEAVKSYTAAVRLLPDSPLLRLGLGQTQVALEDPSVLPDAIDNLRHALSHDPGNAFAWQQLAIATGRNGDLGHSALASAERAMLLGQGRDAKHFAVRAQKVFSRGSPGWLRAQDIEQAADRAIEKSQN